MAPKDTVDLRRVTVLADGRPIVDDVSWTVGDGELWVVLGANGSGKTTLLQVAAAQRFPSRGDAWVLGARLGSTDMRALRARIGFAGASLGAALRSDILVRDAVMTARHGALEPWWHTYTGTDRALAQEVLARSHCAELADRPLDTLSQGERQRVLVARAFMVGGGLVVLDEPAAGLDFVSRERLVDQIDGLAREPGRATVLVTHHLEEVPPAATHALLLRHGRVVTAGPVDDVLHERHLAACFGVPMRVERHDGRWAAWATGERS